MVKTLPVMEVQHKCANCDMRGDRYFCNLPDEVLRAFSALKITNMYPKGATLYSEDEEADGVYMLCQGRIKLSTFSPDGRALILRIVEPGEMLGLSSAISDTPHEATAEAIEPCQVNFIRRSDLLKFLHDYADVGLNALRQLSRNYHTAYTQVRSFGLSATVGDKLVKLMLDWCRNAASSDNCVRLKQTFSHEEIAEMIGTSRETVTRLLKEFKERGLITVKGVDLIIHDRRRLEAFDGARLRPRGSM